MRIMIVDDNRAFREATRHLLSKNPSYQVVAEAENGEQALEIFENESLDLVLMDIELPVMSGIETTKLMLKKNKTLKIVAISAYQDKIYLKDIIGAGFKGFVNKNNVFEQLEEAILHTYVGKLYIPDELKPDL